jgi:hypothetical protein
MVTVHANSFVRSWHRRQGKQCTWNALGLLKICTEIPEQLFLPHENTLSFNSVRHLDSCCKFDLGA